MLNIIRRFNAKRTLPTKNQVDGYGSRWIPVYMEIEGKAYYYQKIERNWWGCWKKTLQWSTCVPKRL